MPPIVYPYVPYMERRLDPQLTGWPLTDEGKKFILQAEFEKRKPGSEIGKRFKEYEPVTPAAGYWPVFWGNTDPGDTQWLNIHTKLVETVQAVQEPLDLVLIGDSITQGWGGGWNGPEFNTVWKSFFSNYKTLNLGISGDKVENILWRLDHGAIDGLQIKALVLMVGINNHPNQENGKAIAEGIRLCIQNIQKRTPETQIILVKTPPAAKENVLPLHAALDEMKLDQDPLVHIIDLNPDLTNLDGSLKSIGYVEDKIHLDAMGYEVLATRLRPVLKKILGHWGNGIPDHSSHITLTLLDEQPSPAIQEGFKGTEGIKYGVEGGSIIKLNDTYHYFAAEIVGEPRWNKMKLAHWTSTDRFHWDRRSTIAESSGSTAGDDPRAALWAPMPIYDQKENIWNIFYVAYNYLAPFNCDGRIWHAISTVKGVEGIHGPWKDIGIIMQPDTESQTWEGAQGVDSFYPYQVGNQWFAFYGSSDIRSYFRVGLASAPSLAGPWKRLSQGNPVALSGPRGSENPIVTRLKSGRYIAVFETVFCEDGFGYSDSADGIHWSEAKELKVKASTGKIRKVRTPLGLTEEPDGSFSVFYTAFNKEESHWGELWPIRVKVIETH